MDKNGINYQVQTASSCFNHQCGRWQNHLKNTEWFWWWWFLFGCEDFSYKPPTLDAQGWISQYESNPQISANHPKGIHSLKLTYPPKMVVSNRNLLFQGSIFRGYVSFREGKYNFEPSKIHQADVLHWKSRVFAPVEFVAQQLRSTRIGRWRPRHLQPEIPGARWGFIGFIHS